jgi:hypothetical protein
LKQLQKHNAKPSAMKNTNEVWWVITVTDHLKYLSLIQNRTAGWSETGQMKYQTPWDKIDVCGVVFLFPEPSFFYLIQ